MRAGGVLGGEGRLASEGTTGRASVGELAVISASSCFDSGLPVTTSSCFSVSGAGGSVKDSGAEVAPPKAMVMPAAAGRAEASGASIRTQSSESEESRTFLAFFKNAGLGAVRRGGCDEIKCFFGAIAVCVTK